MFRLFRNEKGFTMIEMMVVLIIIAVLVGGGIKFYTGYITKAKITKAKSDITSIQAGLDVYYAEKGKYPTDDDGLKAAYLDTDVVDTSGDKTYVYSNPDGDENKYEVKTRVKVDGTNIVKGEGENGSSTPPDLVEE